MRKDLTKPAAGADSSASNALIGLGLRGKDIHNRFADLVNVTRTQGRNPYSRAANRPRPSAGFSSSPRSTIPYDRGRAKPRKKGGAMELPQLALRPRSRPRPGKAASVSLERGYELIEEVAQAVKSRRAGKHSRRRNAACAAARVGAHLLRMMRVVVQHDTARCSAFLHSRNSCAAPRLRTRSRPALLHPRQRVERDMPAGHRHRHGESGPAARPRVSRRRRWRSRRS